MDFSLCGFFVICVIIYFLSIRRCRKTALRPLCLCQQTSPYRFRKLWEIVKNADEKFNYIRGCSENTILFCRNWGSSQACDTSRQVQGLSLYLIKTERHKQPLLSPTPPRLWKSFCILIVFVVVVVVVICSELYKWKKIQLRVRITLSISVSVKSMSSREEFPIWKLHDRRTSSAATEKPEIKMKKLENEESRKSTNRKINIETCPQLQGFVNSPLCHSVVRNNYLCSKNHLWSHFEHRRRDKRSAVSQSAGW